MIEGLIGKKVGMTQIFDENGVIAPVTVIQAGPCVVIQKKTQERDGYEAVQMGFVEKAVSKKRTNKAMQGHFEKSGAAPLKVLREFSYKDGENIKEGDQVSVSMFENADKVDIVGISKGKGFAGVMKRHGFSGGRATHGSMFHRAPGSIGAAAYPAKVWKGQKMPGRMGNARIVAKNLKVIKIQEDQNLLVVRGAVPGARGGYLLIKRSRSAGIEQSQAEKNE
jgi:large subunit ribosomal protein L3